MVTGRELWLVRCLNGGERRAESRMTRGHLTGDREAGPGDAGKRPGYRSGQIITSWLVTVGCLRDTSGEAAGDWRWLSESYVQKVCIGS